MKYAQKYSYYGIKLFRHTLGYAGTYMQYMCEKWHRMYDFYLCSIHDFKYVTYMHLNMLHTMLHI